MTNFLLTLIVVLIAGNQAYRVLIELNEHPHRGPGVVGWFFTSLLLLIIASGISYGLLLIFNKYLTF